MAASITCAPGGNERARWCSRCDAANGIGLSPDETEGLRRGDADGAHAGHTTSCSGGEIKPVETLYRNEKGVCLAGLGGYQMFDSLALEGVRQHLRRDPDQGRHHR